MCMCPMYRWRFDELFTDVQYWGVLCVVQVGYDLGVKTVLVSGCFGAQCSVAPVRGQQFKERVSWMWGVQSDFLSPFLYSGGVKLLEAGQRGIYIHIYIYIYAHIYTFIRDMWLYILFETCWSCRWDPNWLQICPLAISATGFKELEVNWF